LQALAYFSTTLHIVANTQHLLSERFVHNEPEAHCRVIVRDYFIQDPLDLFGAILPTIEGSGDWVDIDLDDE
jgi:hypothetical protein